MKKNLDEDIECIYSDKFIDNKCSSCDDPLFISEDGFYCCSNKSCGVIYKDVLDFGAGPGSEVLPKDFQNNTRPDENALIAKQYLPDLVIAAKSKYAPDSFKRFVNFLMAQ